MSPRSFEPKLKNLFINVISTGVVSLQTLDCKEQQLINSNYDPFGERQTILHFSKQGHAELKKD